MTQFLQEIRCASDVVARDGLASQVDIGEDASGRASVRFGPASDAILYRLSTGQIRLNAGLTVDGGLTSSGQFAAGPSGAVKIDSTFGTYAATLATAGLTAFRAQQAGDANSRFAMQATGYMAWGDGTAVADVALNRFLTGVLQIVGGLQITTTLAVTGVTTLGTLAVTTISGTPNFSGAATGQTAAADTTTSQLATTQFVVQQAASVNPVMDGTAAVGTSKRYARQDHVHPIDTSRAPAASPTLTGNVNVSGNFIRPTVSSLPTTGLSDGMEVYYLVNATDGIVWHLRYRSGSGSTYKWEFLGGASLYAETSNDETLAAATTTYSVLPTAVSVAIALAGEYRIEMGARGYPWGVAQDLYQAADGCGLTAADADAVTLNCFASTGSIGSRTIKRTLTTGTLAQKYRHSSSGATANWSNRFFTVTPIRVI